jgi:polysaccharide pyruvyl transferase CsaB
VGYFGFGNTGDEACLQKTKKLILSLDPSPQFQSLSTLHKEDGHVYRWSLRRVIKALLWSDKVVFSGGSLFQNVTSTMSLLYYCGIGILGRVFRKEVLLLGQGYGPVRGVFQKKLVSWVLGYMTCISARDSDSFDQFIACNKAVVASSDLTFWRPSLEQISFLESDKIVFSFRDSQLDKKTVKTLLKPSLEKSVAMGYMVFSTQEDESLLKVLETDFEEIVRLTDFYDSGTLFSGRVLVAMRYHACVWAAMRGIPFLALSYDPKVTALARSLNQEVIDIQKGSIDLSNYFKTLKRVYEQAEMYHQRLKEALPEKIKEAEYHQEVFR